MWDRIGIQPEILCAGKETTFEFLEGMLEEIVGLFPGVDHIGGDEAPKERWLHCPDCGARMHSLGIQDPVELQTWMTNRITAFLRSRGRGTITWNDSLGPGLDPEVRIQYWFRHKENLIDAARRGRAVICSSFWDCYLDHGYALTPLKRAYDYEPVFRELDADAASSIVGIEAPLWTEMVPDSGRLWYPDLPAPLRVCRNRLDCGRQEGLELVHAAAPRTARTHQRHGSVVRPASRRPLDPSPTSLRSLHIAPGTDRPGTLRSPSPILHFFGRSLHTAVDDHDEKRSEKRIAELSRKLREYQHAYFVKSAPLVSDAEYDRLFDQLTRLETEFPDLGIPDSPTRRVGSDLTQELPEVAHTIPVLSLDKSYTIGELTSWIGKTRAMPNGAVLRLRGEDRRRLHRPVLREGGARASGHAGQWVGGQ